MYSSMFSVQEARYQFTKALPMIIAGTIRSGTSILELRALGHIGAKPLAGRSLALLVVNLTGYPFMYGLGGALESLCSQAFTGAHDNKRIGVYVQHAIWVFLVANIFVTLLWLYPNVIFMCLGKTDNEVLHYTRLYLMFECLYFPCVVVQTCLKRFLLAQGLMRPTIYFELAGFIAMYLGLWIFVWNPSTSLGFVGVPLAATAAYATVLLVNALYICLAPCRREWGAFTMAGFSTHAKQIIGLGIPCGVSGIASYGFSDLATIGVATMGSESLAIQAVLNSSKSAFSRTGSYLGMVMSNRVGNLLGAQQPIAALMSAKVSVTMTIAVTSMMALLMLVFQEWLAAFITKDERLVARLVPLVPMLVLVVAFDMTSNVLTGILRGQSRQGIAATIRVISLYGFAVPLAYVLCFVFDMKLYGLWIGLSTGFIAISVAEFWLVFTSDWAEEAKKCLERVNEGSNRHRSQSHLRRVDSSISEETPLLNSRIC